MTWFFARQLFHKFETGQRFNARLFLDGTFGCARPGVRALLLEQAAHGCICDPADGSVYTLMGLDPVAEAFTQLVSLGLFGKSRRGARRAP